MKKLQCEVNDWHIMIEACGNQNAYSDSKSDLPMLNLAKKAYIVKGEELILYDKNYKFKTSKLERFRDRDFLLFIFCADMGTLTNFIFSSLISISINSIISYVIGYAISLFVAYYLNTKLIFKDRLSLVKFIKFIISSIPKFIILFTFVFIFINILNLNHILTYLLVALVDLPITYIFVKYFVFKNNKTKKKEV